jgi:hypothetical protein
MGAAGFHQVLVQSRIDGPTLTAAAAASMIPVRDVITLPNNYWVEGRSWRITASGRISCVVTTPGTARFDLRLGSVVAWDGLAINLNTTAKTNVGWWLDAVVTCRTIASGVASNLIGQGRWTSEAIIAAPLPAAGGQPSMMLPVATAPAVGTSFNNALANTVDMFFTQTVATGSMTCHQFMIEELDRSY